MKTDIDVKTFAKNLKHLRMKNNLTKKEMAGKLGIGIKTLNALESGVLPPRFGANTVFIMQRKFGFSPSQMFGVDLSD
ncbi:MAG: helix-turn-helix transcriptional regulator [Clostridia bacterium]|nr:helix-turn-helix transcriptional regulator [Clostridia bacterium]